MPLIAFLKTKTEKPASAFSTLPNITISIPEQRRINPKHNAKKNFVLDELVFLSSDSSSENVSEEESFLWYCGKCYKEISPGHLKVNYDNCIECDVCKQCYHTICENFDPDIDERVFSSSDSSNESVNEDDSFVCYYRKCYEETSPAHLKVNYDN